MLLIIFGAGASYDSSPKFLDFRPGYDVADRPPLAKELFHEGRFSEQMARHSGCDPLFARLRRLGIQPDASASIEQELERVRDESGRYRHVALQMIELRSYLKEVIERCINGWVTHIAGANNYATLLDEVERWRSDNRESVAFVTFNYDTLLDQALSSILRVGLGNMDSYIANPRYKLFKVHGSMHWMRKVVGYLSWRDEQANVLQWTDDFLMYRDSGGYDAAYYLPAIAVPVVNKSEFECPSAHINQLQEILPKVDRVLMVGWRTMESHFLELWASVGNTDAKRMHVVAGTDGQAVVDRLASAGIVSRDTRHSEGFSRFLLDGGLNAFLYE